MVGVFLSSISKIGERFFWSPPCVDICLNPYKRYKVENVKMEDIDEFKIIHPIEIVVYSLEWCNYNTETKKFNIGYMKHLLN